MKIPALPFTTTDWDTIAPETHAGETGMAYWRTQTFGEIRVRMVDYSPGYSADHWCSKGHVILCVSGSFETQLADGQVFTLRAGQSYHVGDDGDSPHRTSTVSGARLFIVD